MSTDADKDPACPNVSGKSAEDEVLGVGCPNTCDDESEKKRPKGSRKVSFPPEEDQLVTQYFEPANPWQDVPPTTRQQLAEEYLQSCRRHNTEPIESVLEQIQELPESCIGGMERAPCLSLAHCSLLGSAPADSLEALLSKTQFRTVALHYSAVDDEGAEALFDMIEYYESATKLIISGPREFDVRGWQAASRMIKKSAELTELEVNNSDVSGCQAAVLARSLRAHTCRLLAVCLQHAGLCGEPLRCLVCALKSNKSVRELRLGDNKLTAGDALQLASLLRVNPRIQLLDLSNNIIEDKGVGHIADALVEQASVTPPSAATSPLSPLHAPVSGYEGRGLAFLVLWNNQLTKNCADHISKVLSLSRSLCVLNVGRNSLGCEWVSRVPHAGALLSLGLQAARLGSAAAASIAHLVRASACLQRLDLRDNKLGGSGLQSILAALKENSSIIQIDLDECSESTTTLTADNGGESASCARLTREIKSLCRRNETVSATEHRVHRKISLTCHTDKFILRGGQSPEEERRGRLRSPAPSPGPSPGDSPAGSPVPGAQHSRFSVTRVTPERESSTSSTDSCSPSTPTRPSPSRFRVMQVSEPPQIQVQPCTSDTPRRPVSRFSVTRNYDTMYNPSPPNRRANSDNKHNETCSRVGAQSAVSDVIVTISDACVQSETTKSDSKGDFGGSDISVITEVKSEGDLVIRSDLDTVTKTHDKIENLSRDEGVCKKREDKVLIQETQLVKNSSEIIETDKVDVPVDVTVETESVVDTNYSNNDSCKIVNSNAPAKVHNDQNNTTSAVADEILNDNVNISQKQQPKENNDKAIIQIEAITQDLDNLLQEMQEFTHKTAILTRKPSEVEFKVRNDSTKTEMSNIIDITVEKDTINTNETFLASVIRDNVVLKKNKSESSLDSPDLEVFRLMSKKSHPSPFRDSSSSLEISGSSMESLNALDNQNIPKISKPIVEKIESELDRRKPEMMLSTESSVESASENTANNSGHFLNTSVSSTESVSPIFCKDKKIHGSLSSLEASVSSLDSAQCTEKIMVTSMDSGIEYSLQNPSESKEDASSNEGTLTSNSNLKDTSTPDPSVTLQNDQATLTSPKRASSLLDVPAIKNKNLGRIRKISWVAPSASFHIPKPEIEISKPVESKLPTNLEKLLSLFHNPGSLFSRSNEEEKKSASNTPPRKESTSLSSSFWSWGSSEKCPERDEKSDDSSPEVTDSTLSERVQVSFVDESFSRKLDSKTPSTDTDTDNTLSEFQSLPQNSESEIEKDPKVTTDDNLVQNSLDLGLRDTETSDNTDLIKPNDVNRNVYDVQLESKTGDIIGSPEHKNIRTEKTEVKDETKNLEVRPRSFAAVLKSSGSENSLDRPSPENGQSVDKLSSKVIRGIKENISPENTLTSSMTNTKTLALELTDRQIKNQPIVNVVWEITNLLTDKIEIKTGDVKTQIGLESVIVDTKTELVSLDKEKLSTENIDANFTRVDDKGATSVEPKETLKTDNESIEIVDLGKDALSYLIYENQDFEPDAEIAVTEIKTDKDIVLSEELRDAEIKQQLIDLSPELVLEDVIKIPEVFPPKEVAVPIPDRVKIKKSNSLEELSQRLQNLGSTESIKEIPKTKSKIVFKVPECSGTSPRDIPMRRPKLRSKSGSSPKSLPETLNRPLPISKLESVCFKKKKKVSSLGKIARDSLLALNKSDDEIADIRREYKLTSVESLRSLESVSEDANSQSGNSVDSRCRSCFRTSQESLMSLDSITEDCKCVCETEKEETSQSAQ